MIGEYFFYFGVLCLVFLLTFGVGSLLEYPIRKENILKRSTSHFYVRLLLGTIGIVTAYSIIRTSGVTINILFLFLGGLFLIEHKKSAVSTEPIFQNKLNLGYVFIGALLIYSWNFWYMLEEGGRFGLPFKDYTFYAILSYYIDYSGVENTLYNNYMLDNNFSGVAYYHYFEMWLNAFIAKLGNLNFALTFQLVTLPFLQTIAFIGILEIFKSYQAKLSILAFVFCLFLLFVGCVELPFYKHISFLNTAGEFSGNYLGNFYRLKFSYTYFFLIAAALSFVKRRYFIAYLFMMCIPIASFTNFPSVIGCLLLVFTFKLFTDKSFSKKYLIYTFLFVFFMMGFYTVFEKTAVDEGALTYYDTGYFLEIFSLNLPSMITRFNIIVKSSLQYSIFYLPFLLIGLTKRQLLFKFVRQNLNLIFIILGLYFVGLVVWSILFRDHNAIQIFMSPAIGINVLLFFFLIYLFTNISKQSKLLLSSIIGIFAILNFYSTFQDYILSSRFHVSKDFIGQVNQFLESEDSVQPVLGGSIKHPKEFATLRQTSYLKVKGYYLPYLKDGVVPFRLTNSELNIKVEGAIEKELLERYGYGSTFNQYVLSGQKNNTCLNELECQVAFVKQYNLRYLLVSKGVELSTQLMELVNSNFVDENTGDTFYILKRFN